MMFLYHIQPARGWCATVKRDCANCIHLILPLRKPRPSVFLGSQSCDLAAWLAENQLLAGDIESNPGPKPTLKPFYTHSLNTLIHQSNPLNPPTLTLPSPLTHICPIPSAKHTLIPQSIYSTAHTYILKQHTGPLDVSREGDASASQVERTPGRATLTY